MSHLLLPELQLEETFTFELCSTKRGEWCFQRLEFDGRVSDAVWFKDENEARARFKELAAFI